MTGILRGLVALGLPLVVIGVPVSGRVWSQPAPRPAVILSTTTSVQDSGLLDLLVPLFEKKTGYTAKTIAVGTGQALALAARGEADVTLAHSPELEKRYVAEGKLVNRRLVMYNDFALAGPPEDPARLRGAESAAEAMRRIAESRARFVSRGDGSGTHLKEKALWKLAGVEPRGAWYIESGQGMAATLGIAGEKRAYTLTDRATHLAFRKRFGLEILLERDKRLLNLYSVLEASPAGGPRVNAAGGKAVADFLLSAETQQVIRRFGVEKFGQPLFVPAADQKEDEIGG